MFQHHYSSLLQCHMTLQKSFLYADLALKKHLLYYFYCCITVEQLNIFCGNCDGFSYE